MSHEPHRRDAEDRPPGSVLLAILIAYAAVGTLLCVGVWRLLSGPAGP